MSRALARLTLTRNLARAGAGLAVVVASLSATSLASAYCRTASCQVGTDHSAAVCVPAYSADCGTPIAWPSPCTEFSVQQDGSPKLGITAAQLSTLLTTAFASWRTSTCAGGGSPLMVVTEGPEASCHQIQYNQDTGNANVVMFDDDSWPYDGTPNILALTTVTYSVDTAAIYDADMELNSAENHFTLGSEPVEYDLLSILTHETGHFQGMAHTHDAAATMWPSYDPGTTTLRTLSADDIAGICAIYPPGTPDPSCDPTPRNGFSPLCACTSDGGTDGGACDPPQASSGGCTVRPSGEHDHGAPVGPVLVGLAAALAACGIGRRKRARSEARGGAHRGPVTAK